MSTLEDLNSSSSDSDDCDYVPEGEVSDVSVDESEDESAEKEEIGVKGKNKKSKAKDVEIQEPKSECLEPDTKQRTEDIWKKFLDDVGTTSKKKKNVDRSTEQSTIADEKSVAANSDLSTLLPPKKTVTTEIFEFAGESIAVTKKMKDNIAVSKTSESCKAAAPEQQKMKPLPVAPKRQGGLGNLIGNIMNKKPKMTILQKSQYDWNSFKKEEGLDEDLEKFNKGKGGFLEKQAFLQRSDIRQFELEKSVRLSSKTKR